jgi:hypothetical protein
MVAAAEAQRRRVAAGQPPRPERWDGAAVRFSADPRRAPDRNLQAIMDYVAAEDVVLDVGGGAGRYGLPLALHCREVVNVEPSQGMGRAFGAAAKGAGISNARWLGEPWETADITGDVVLVAHVTYFVAHILPFLRKLHAAARKRVIIATNVTPPPNQGADLFALLHDEPQARTPDFRELLPVLWEMGLVPEVRVLDPAQATSLGGVFETAGAAVQAVLAQAPPQRRAAKTRELEARFAEFFLEVPGGFRRRPSGDPRLMLITWQTAAAIA